MRAPPNKNAAHSTREAFSLLLLLARLGINFLRLNVGRGALEKPVVQNQKILASNPLESPACWRGITCVKDVRARVAGDHRIYSESCTSTRLLSKS